MSRFPAASASGEASSCAYSGLGEVVAPGNVRNSRRAPANSARGRKNRYRCQTFRKREQSTRVLGMIDAEGRRYSVEQEGHLNTITHDTVLKLLERRALRLHKHGESNVDNANNTPLDETGTIDVSELQLREIEQQEKIDMVGVSDEVLRVHGVMPGRKQDGITRLLYENLNSLPNRQYGNYKLEKAKNLIHEWEADLVGAVEHRQNLAHKQNKNGWNQLFQRMEEDVRSVVAHNIHENILPVQEGGTGLLMFGPLIDYLDVKSSGKDLSGLGRWTMMLVKGDDIQTRIICGYNPCKPSRTKQVHSKTSYAQQRRYLIHKRKDIDTCPRDLFRNDLINQLIAWREKGDRLIVCLDANENIYRGSIGKALTDASGLAMKEVVQNHTTLDLGATYFRGSEPIDGIWATSDIAIANACVMPAGYGIGDHRLFVVDIITSSMVGVGTPKLQRLAARRLNTKLPGVAERYAKSYEKNLKQHRLIEKLGEVHMGSRSKEEAEHKIQQIDAVAGQFMAHAEKKCRRFKTGRIRFSPEAVAWIKRKQIYQSLLERRQGKKKNRGNLKRAARRQQIRTPFALAMEEIKTRLAICNKQIDYFRVSGDKYRRKHLFNRVDVARRAGNEAAATQILALIQRERQRTFWRKLNYTCGKKKGGSPTSIQVEGENNVVVEYNTQESVQKAIWENIHLNRFYLAEAAPICNGYLRGKFGYNATSATAQAVLDGTYNYPNGFDQATQELCEECTRIRLRIPKNSIRTSIRQQEWDNHWRKAKEETSSSFSGRHFGHYKASRQSMYISHFQSLLASLILHHGLVLDRWACGLSIMLQKIHGCSLVTKLRSILLMEADFNGANKILYGIRMLNKVRKYGMMPSEIYSERGRMAEDGTLAKVLCCDIIRQTRLSAGIASVDADNCFDRIAHPIASMVFQALGVPSNAAESMLSTIQEMKFFLRTGYGDSKNCAGSKIEIKTQGLCQGNGAAGAGWAVVSICIISAHKRKGHGAQFLCPITKLRNHIAGVLYVDDTDLIHFQMDKREEALETLFNLQESIISWGNLLIASGGALKPCKCFYYLISFSWNPDGSWEYSKNEKDADGEVNEEFRLSIPLADGTTARIQHLGVHEATKTLGSMTSPSGCNNAAISAMYEKSMTWGGTIKEGRLSRRNVWFMMGIQFWPRVSYGLCTNTASFDTLSECMMKPYLQIQQQGGVRSSARRGIRQLSLGFYGIGCPHPAIECFIAQVNKLLSHYGSTSSLGLSIQSSVELFVIELGLSTQPFTTDHALYHKLVTHSWIKSLWEKATRLKVKIILGNLTLIPPRGDNDYWLMAQLTELCTPDQIVRLNRVRLHQQVIFGSDIMNAGGRSIDSKYLWKRPHDESWSTLHFPMERPPKKDFALWRKILPQLRSIGRLPLGSYVNEGHKVWDWRYDLEEQILYHRHNNNAVDIFTPLTTRGPITRANAWHRVRIDQPRMASGQRCTVESIDNNGTVRIIANTPIPPPPKNAQTFREVLNEWKCDWMWKDLRLTGDDTWIASAIRDNSLMAVTDGSFMCKTHAHINSCAFIMECSKGRGRLTGAFFEPSMAACSYRGELLGLLAIHFILLSVHKTEVELHGSVHIYSDCLIALQKVKNLPNDRIPSQCKHSDILKNIMIHCNTFAFQRIFSHVRAHQDDKTSFSNLTRPAQLNCACDFAAKRILLQLSPLQLPKQECLPLETVSVWAGNEKLTTDTAHRLRFFAHKEIAREELTNAKILTLRQFDRVDWEMVHRALSSVPRMFQIFACKQVFDIAGTNRWLALFDRTKEKSPLCPSCMQSIETSAHVLQCGHAGRTETLTATIKLLDAWMKKSNTDPTLRECAYHYTMGRGRRSMVEICRSKGYNERYRRLARAQDDIGWRRFMEGMICLEWRQLQHEHTIKNGLLTTAKGWAEELIIKLLEITHGQWLYRNIQVHDKISGLTATVHKEEIQSEIEAQQAMGFDGFLEEDAFLGECNLGDLEITSGTNEIYWLLAVKAAREAMRIKGRDRTEIAIENT